jgi:abortive infection bacteriophage resistance protein
MQYNKPAYTIAQQIAQLQARGLLINDINEAEHFLSSISYYRLAGYWWPLQADKINHTFKPGSEFETVISLYNFDRELRLLLFDVIERIEVAFRTKLIYYLSTHHSPWWFEDPSLFTDQGYFFDNLSIIDNELKRSQETFIVEHKRKYWKDNRRPPAWKTLEIVTLGQLSKLYNNLKPSVPSKDQIAQDLLLRDHTFLKSWLYSISHIRNFCAHHARDWNKNLSARPKLMNKPLGPWIHWVPPEPKRNMLYTVLCCMKYLLFTVSPGNHFTQKLSDLLQKYPKVDLNALGFPQDWQDEPLWQK